LAHGPLAMRPAGRMFPLAYLAGTRPLPFNPFVVAPSGSELREESHRDDVPTAHDEAVNGGAI
jgi:hypothetical protein